MRRRVYIVGDHLVLGVDTASEEDAGFLAIEEGSTEEILRGTVSITVTPVAGVASGQGIRHVSDGIIDNTMVAIHINEEFVACIGIGHVGFMGD